MQHYFALFQGFQGDLVGPFKSETQRDLEAAKTVIQQCWTVIDYVYFMDRRSDGAMLLYRLEPAMVLEQAKRGRLPPFLH